MLKPLLEELPLKQAAHLAAQIAAVRDNEAYKRALELKRSGMVRAKSRPGSRCVRKHMEESPGSTGQGAR